MKSFHSLTCWWMWKFSELEHSGNLACDSLLVLISLTFCRGREREREERLVRGGRRGGEDGRRNVERARE